MVTADEFTPTFNQFVQRYVIKGENVTYADAVGALTTIHTAADRSTGPVNVERLLTRLTQFGYLRVSSVEALLSALRASATQDTPPTYVRLLFYLVQLALGNGAAGTPLPQPSIPVSPFLPKAVDTFGPEILSAAWADLSDERSPFMRKQGAMRVLAALAQAAVTSKPDDPTYPGGVFVTLQSLLERIDQLQSSRKSLAAVLAATVAGEGGAAAKRKNMVADFKKSMETWSLLRLAFGSARVALGKVGQIQIAQRSFGGVCSTDAVCARHSLALASLVAREGGGAGLYINSIGPALQNNLETARRLGIGLLFSAGAKGSHPPTVQREDSSNQLNLKDVFSRVYLARGCAAAIQGAMGDPGGSVLWEALVMMACADTSDLVSLESIRAMFGAPYPHAESLRRRSFGLTEQDLAEVSMQGRTYAACWQMAMSTADATLPVPPDALPPVHESVQGNAFSRPSVDASGGSADAAATMGTSVFGRIVSRLMFALQSRSCSLVAAAARTAAILLEARAWFGGMGMGPVLETEGVRRGVRVLQGMLMAVFSSDGLGAVERCAAAEGLVWLQLSPEDPRQPLITPSTVLKAAAQGGLAVQSIVSSLFADPWPESVAASFLNALVRRQRCSPALAPWCCELAAALAAATPAGVPRDLLMALWDTAPPAVGLKAAVDVLGSPLPPVTQPANAAPVEIKAFASMEEQAYENVKRAAAWWVGEHANALAGVFDWKAAPKATVSLEGLLPPSLPTSQLELGEKLTLAAMAHGPLLLAAMAHLQRHMLAGSWEVRVACAQGLSKIAVRSPEPFRIQAYTSLRSALAGQGTTADGRPAPLSSWLDPLGLAPVVLPGLEVIDAIYGGRQVLATHLNLHGTDPKAWPVAHLASVRRRHEWLLTTIAQRIGGVPPTYYPLGPKCRALLNPDEPEEAEAVEADEDEKALDAAADAAAAGDDDGYSHQYDEYGQPYDEGYYDDRMGASGAFAYETDAIAKWQAGEYGANADSQKFGNVKWSGLGEDNGAQTYAADDDDEARYGTVLYTFVAGSEEELTVSEGERVRVHVNMGDWLHVTGMSGQQGIVPASYVQVDESTGRQESEIAMPAPGSSFYAPPSPMPGGGDGYSGYDGGYEGGAYRPYGMYDGQQAADYSLYDRDGEEGDDNRAGAAGGFDDFGALLLQAAEARAAAAARATEQSAVPPRAGSSNSSFTAAPSGQLQSTASAATSVGLTSAYSMQSSVGGATAETPRIGGQTSFTPASSAAPDAYASNVGAYGGGYVFDVSRGASGLDAAQSAADSSVIDYGAGLGQQPEAGGEEAPPPEDIPVGSRVQAEFDFTAEAAEELSVTAGDQLEVTSSADGWVMVFRAADGRSGLVPANYVRML